VEAVLEKVLLEVPTEISPHDKDVGKEVEQGF